MKRKLLLLTIMMISLQLSAQDHGSWVIPPYQIDFYESGPVVDEIFPVPSNQYNASAAAFKNNGDLLFYLVDNAIYDNSSNIIGSLQLYNMHCELEIINVPGEIDIFYIIYGWIAPYDGALRYAKIDCSTSAPAIIYDYEITNTFEWAAFAITEESGNARNLYIVAQGGNGLSAGLFKYSITPLGISYISTITDANNPVLNNPDYFLGHNLELSPDELTLAWCSRLESDKVYIVNLTEQGTFLSGAKVQLNATFINGIEFANDPLNQSLYISCKGVNCGIYQINYSTNQLVGKLNNSDNYSQTFLQTAADGYIYAVSNNGENLGRINTTNSTFTPQVITDVNILSYLYTGSEAIYIIPNDKKLYSMLDIELSSTFISCPGYNDGTATATPIGGTPPYSYFWTPGGQTTQTITNLSEGTYHCCVTDAIGDVVCDDIDVILTPGLFDFDYELVFDQPYSITVNNWDYTFKDGFRVKSGSNVTMEDCDLQFAKYAKVIVEQGGTLILNNCNFSNFTICEGMWQGIEVWGVREENQWPDAQGNYAQGYLELNDAVIENAIVAVSLWKPGDYSSSGGIVETRNTVFKNNKRSVHAIRYTNFHPVNGKEMDYRATFTHCKFELDVNYPGLETFYKHVDLDQVRGVKFTACDFSLSSDAPNVSTYNMAIGSYSAGFSVNAICADSYIPCQTYDHCTFAGFHWAINANNTLGSTRTFFVNQALFNGNAYGIYTSGINNFTVLNSVFNIGYNEPESDPCDSEGKAASSYGIHMTGCTGFAIEENYFTIASGEPEGNYTGILCKDSETFHDVIYRNIFNGLSFGNFAEGLNRSDPNYDLTGLEYQCNTNTGNNRDFIVTGGYSPQIRGYQGSMSREAGNSFSTGVQLPDGHFKNTGTQVINYCYNTNAPVYYTPYYVMPIPNAGANTCPSNYGGGSGGSTRDVVLTEDEKQDAELAFANNLSDFNNVKSLFDNLVDGGNTQALKTEVETAWPSDMWALREELLGKSPHLSKEVLMAAADKTDVLPESILFEILSANPDELRQEELISHLENKEQPLPAYMVSILRQLAGGITYKTILLQDMAGYLAGKTQSAYNLIRSSLNDTITDYTYLRTWLNNLDNLNADLQIVAAYLAEENYAAAQTMLNLIPATRSLEGNELAKYNDYKTLMQMQMAWQQQGRSIFELDSLEVEALVYFVENASGKAALMAKGILEYAFGHHYCNCLPVDDAGAWKSLAAMPGSKVDNGLSIQAVPNPASTWVSFDFSLPVHIDEAFLQITDVHGRNITSFILKEKQGKQVWDVRDMKKGVYLYSLKAGTMSKNGKLIIY